MHLPAAGQGYDSLLPGLCRTIPSCRSPRASVGEAVTGAVPSVAACTEVVTQWQAYAVGIRIAATHGCLEWAGTPLAVMHLRVRTLRDVERTEHGLECSHYDLPSAPRGSTIALLGVASHPHVLCHRVPPRGTSCPSRRCAHPAVAGAWVCARGVVRHGHDTTSGIDARAVAPVRPQGRHGWPCRRRPHAADGPQEGARNH